MSWFWWIVLIIIGLIILYFVLTTNIASRVYTQALDLAYKKYAPQPVEEPQVADTQSPFRSTSESRKKPSSKGANIRDVSDHRLSKFPKPPKNTHSKEMCPTVNAIIEDVEYEWDDISKSYSNHVDRVQQVNQQLPNIVSDVYASGVQWKSQEICCRIMESFTGAKFERNAKPSFLKNPETGKNLEVDCYHEKYGGLEYNGIQHYRYPNPFHKSEEEFIKYIRKDKYKVAQFERVGKNLIVVPYTVKRDDFADFISSRLPDDGEFYRN